MSEIYPAIEYKISSSVMGDLDDWISEIHGEIFNYNGNDEAVVIGKCRHFFVDLEHSGALAHDLLDVRGELASYICMYDLDTNTFIDEVQDTCDLHEFASNLLVIDRIEILPEYRGNSLAKIIIDDAVNLFSPNTDVIALMAFPLQNESHPQQQSINEWQKAMDFKSLESDEISAEESLRIYYESIGFISLKEKWLMVRRNA